MSSFTLAAPAFGSGAAIPDEYTCRGSDISPVLAWSGEPAKTASFALIVDDPDAPAGTWVHWVIWNIPANMQLLPKDVIKSGSLYAVDVKFSLQPGAKRHDLDAAMKGHILGKAEHMGTFRR